MARSCLAGSVLAIAVAIAPASSGDPLPSHADAVVGYTIVASLDAATHTVTGREQVTWKNLSGGPVHDLWLHLYLNAFRNTQSTFMRESYGQLRDIDMPEGGWGWIDLTRLTLADGTDLLSHATFESPDDGNADDRTVLKVMLPAPVPAGGELSFDASFTAHLPRIFARTGYSRDYHLVGQWFPKLGVYEPVGMRGRSVPGWNCHQFHANSEFYADYGTFDVAITTPARFIVGATGELTSTAKGANGTVTRRYRQRDVHDFAWTADPSFVEVTGHFSGTRDVSDAEYRAGRGARRPLGRRDAPHRRVNPPADATLAPAAGRPLSRGGATGHQALRPVVRPLSIRHAHGSGFRLYGGLGSAGMEYPTFITAGTSLLLNHWPFTGIRLPEEVVLHEFGHQFWYGLAGSNEFEEAWLDEGITSYATARLMDRLFGPDDSMATVLGLHVGERDEMRRANGPSRLFDRIRQPAWTYQPGAYGFYSYEKPALALNTLERILGAPVMAKLMRTYAERWRFRHPSSDDFYRAAEDVSGRDLTWFFGPVFEGTGVVEYEVYNLRSNRAPPPAGRLEAPTATTAAEPAGAAPFESTATIWRRGGVVLPQTIRLTFEGGRVETISWNGAERVYRIPRSTPDRLARVDVDPDQHNWLDVNWTNNGLRRAPEASAARAWTTRCLFWLQELVTMAGL